MGQEFTIPTPKGDIVVNVRELIPAGWRLQLAQAAA